ncbi:MAG TPA: site-2 protease family protein [Candidatus Dormibacteraeota bacterium]|nr:site-2 protease family protein [Candidatus Dormibacteraeota bacterium]
MLTTILLVLLIFGLLVFIHELGHFWAAKKAGVVVEEFGFGFPPKIIGRKFKGTVYSLNFIPLGGFVKLKGEATGDTGKGSFGGASFGHKINILLAGVTMNAIGAYLILVWLCLTGLPPIIQNQFSSGEAKFAQPKQVMAITVQEGSPAEKAGIKRGDLLLGEAGGQRFATEDDLLAYTKSHAGRTVQLEVLRDGQTTTRTAKLLSPENKQGHLGVAPFLTYKLKYGLFDSVVTAGGITAQMIWGTLAAFGGLVAGLIAQGTVSEQVAGPVGIVVILSNIAQLGAAYVLVFVASISISLAVINALPLPALDGGRLLMVVAQKLFGRNLSAQAEGLIHTAGFVALIMLMIAVTYSDIKRL